MGVEAVIDKDLASALLAIDLDADVLLIVTDVDAVYAGWGTPEQRAIRRATPAALGAAEFAEGSMGPKVRAACEFVEETGGLAVIGSIADTPALLRGEAGTNVTPRRETDWSSRAEESADRTSETGGRRGQRSSRPSGTRSTAEEVARQLGVDPARGPRLAEARSGSAQYGPNRFAAPSKSSRAGARSCASTATRCRSSSSCAGIVSI